MGLDPQRREQLIDDLARRAAHAHLAAPAILVLEMYKPLAFIGAQLLWATQPFLGLMWNENDVRALARLFEDPANVEQLIDRIEQS